VIHNALGEMYRAAGQLDRALPHYREAIHFYELAGDLYGAARTRYNVALSFLSAGRLADARDYADAAFTQLPDLRHQALSRTFRKRST